VAKEKIELQTLTVYACPLHCSALHRFAVRSDDSGSAEYRFGCSDQSVVGGPEELSNYALTARSEMGVWSTVVPLRSTRVPEHADIDGNLATVPIPHWHCPLRTGKLKRDES